MALTIDKNDVILLAPELGAGLDNLQWEQIIANAALEISSCSYDQARADRLGVQLSAHFATLLKRKQSAVTAGTNAPDAPGFLNHVQVGQVSKGFAIPKAMLEADLSRAGLMTTPYGIEYSRLARLFAPRMAVL